jgi:hypothetical protein
VTALIAPEMGSGGTVGVKSTRFWPFRGILAPIKQGSPDNRVVSVGKGLAGHNNPKEITMSKLTNTQANAVNAYAKYLEAGQSYGEAMRAAAQSLGGTPCSTFLGELARVHATKYGCNYTWDGQGRAVFYTGAESTRETRHDAARMSWTRNVMVWFKPEREAKPAKSMRLSKDLRALAEAYLANFDNVADAVKVLKAIGK